MKIVITIFSVLITFFSVSQKTIDTVLISSSSGLYSSPFQLVLTNTDSSKILYSLDGSYPKEKYKGSITIKESTTLRVKNYYSKKEYVRNFIFLTRKVTLPVICLTVNPSDLFDSTVGIYAKGPNASPDPPYKGANFHKNWERKVHIEYIDTSNKLGFSQQAGIKIFGQYSAMLPQKSFSIHARKRYGKKKIKYQLFPDLPYQKYKSFILRNSGSDYCNTHFRDIMMTSLVKNFNFDVQAYVPCIVFLNGKYWGIYHLREKINEHFLKQHYNVSKDSVAILKHRGDVQQYGRINYNSMLKFIKKTNFNEKEQIDSLSKLMDIDNYLDYNIAQVYFNNIDAGGNIRYWRHRKKGAKWRWILFDTDFGFGLRKGNDVDENTLKNFTTYSTEKWPSPSWSTLIIRKLLENDSIKTIYISKLTRYLNTTFNSDSVISHINEIESLLEEEIPFHFKRWRRRESHWKKNKEVVKDFALKRPGYMFHHMREKFSLDTFYSIQVNYKNLGKVFLDGYEIDSGYSGIYFSHYSYRLKAVPKFGYYFSHWSGDVNSSIYNEQIRINKPTNIVAHFKLKKESIFKGKIKFNEIVIKDSLHSDYIELVNETDSTIDVSGWTIMNGKKKKFKFPFGSIIPPYSFITVFKNSNSLVEEDSNALSGLFNIKERSLIELFSEKEEKVDSIQLSKKLFKDGKGIEYVRGILEKGWKKSSKTSINQKNSKQKEKELEEKIMIGGLIFFVLIILFFLIRFIFVRRKRLHSSTE